MKQFKTITFFAFLFFSLLLMNFSSAKEKKNSKINESISQETKVAYFAGGCFWCVEAIFESVIGVEEVISGYAGGHTINPTYESSNTGKTGHAEAVAVYYNPKKVSFKTLVDVYFGSHNPTTINGQHPDYGSQYRSIAFYNNQQEKMIIENKIKLLNIEVYNGQVVTEVKKIKKFYKAEDYHQDYEKMHPENPYIQNVSIPRLNRFKKKFPQLLKK
ncbi:peptide-methionine (S)-S-oxide reductase MsrA [Tenacibaculum soleae]|uniref:peptide-methionine (S)-S-oxide reductase MsrA n=1 Tax=Tenacibaculum soleae TaxID=447689 RepID=UPI0026E3109A|nr:peptide-methionine (S)-S-oxide reductase MsrA [Tenacibaculum soleae]MDO6743902.1 peptide-methionine (S)-S-oxide reductase MsrA [Tenacibaculum soleae]